MEPSHGKRQKGLYGLRKQVLSNEFSAVINTGLISTGIISGLARGSKQLAIAHAVL